jgi:hypothetical protein
MLKGMIGLALLCPVSFLGNGEIIERMDVPMSYAPENETAIAYWTRPQYLDVRGRMNVGVAAYALEGIEKVEFYLEGDVPTQLEGDFTLDGEVNIDDLNYILENWNTTGPRDLCRVLGNWGEVADNSEIIGTATEELINEETGELEYFFEFDSTQYQDLSRIRICAKVYPVGGIPLCLEGDFQDDKNVCGLDVYPFNSEENILYVAAAGSDDTGDGSFANPFATINHALWFDRPDTNAGKHIKLLEGEHSLPANPTDRDLRSNNSSGRDTLRWVTIESGVSPELCPIVRNDGRWDCKVHYKNLNITPRTEEDQEGLFSGSSTTRSMYWFDNCWIEGVTRNQGKDMIGRSGARIWSIGCTWRRQFQPAMRIVDIQSTYDLISGDVCLANWINLMSNCVTTNRGRAPDPDNPDQQASDGVHTDFFQCHIGGNETDALVYNNIIIRYNTCWDHSGGQMFFGSFGRNTNPDCIFREMAVIGNKLGQWAGITEDMTIGGLLSDDVGRARVFAFGCINTRNMLFQDNIIFGKGNWNGGPAYYVNEQGNPYYVNVKWSRNYRTPDRVDMWMPMPDAPLSAGNFNVDFGATEDRFDPETDTMPWTSPTTGIRYDGDFDGFATHDVRDYIPNEDFLENF